MRNLLWQAITLLRLLKHHQTSLVLMALDTVTELPNTLI